MQHGRPCGFAKILEVLNGKSLVPALLQSQMVPLVLEPSSYDNLSSDVSNPARPFVLFLNETKFDLILSAMRLLANSCAASASSLLVTRFLIFSATDGNFVFLKVVGIATGNDTNWRMGNLFLNQGNPSKQKADTNKSNRNAHWWRTNEKRDPNAMDVDALTMEERGMLLRQGKCFRCKKTGHMAKDCPPEQGELSKKKADLARFAYTTIKALTKEQRESFMKMVMEDKDGEDF
jgi:Zinc knuckle